MIKMMFKYELKKIFSKRVNQVLLAAVLVVTIIYSGMAIGSMRYVDEEGQNHTGIESGRLLAENINQWKGELTAEKISEVINDYKTISAKYPDEIPNHIRYRGMAISSDMDDCDTYIIWQLRKCGCLTAASRNG